MLVLSRKKNESIMIDSKIEIVILGTEGDTVKVGIRAPKEVDIYRKEIYDAIQLSNREAASANVSLEQLMGLMKEKK